MFTIKFKISNDLQKQEFENGKVVAKKQEAQYRELIEQERKAVVWYSGDSSAELSVEDQTLSIKYASFDSYDPLKVIVEEYNIYIKKKEERERKLAEQQKKNEQILSEIEKIDDEALYEKYKGKGFGIYSPTPEQRERVDRAISRYNEIKEQKQREREAEEAKTELSFLKWCEKNGSELLRKRLAAGLNWKELGSKEWFEQQLSEGYVFGDCPDGADYWIKGDAEENQIAELLEVRKDFEADIFRVRFEDEVGDWGDCDVYHKDYIRLTATSPIGIKVYAHKEV